MHILKFICTIISNWRVYKILSIIWVVTLATELIVACLAVYYLNKSLFQSESRPMIHVVFIVLLLLTYKLNIYLQILFKFKNEWTQHRTANNNNQNCITGLTTHIFTSMGCMQNFKLLAVYMDIY